jgi:hypothetical protein
MCASPEISYQASNPKQQQVTLRKNIAQESNGGQKIERDFTEGEAETGHSK